MWGVLFLHPNSAGHCIIFEQGEFRDYQPDPVRTITGAEADEIEDRICFVFSISDHDVTQEAGATEEGAAEGEEDNEGSDKAMDVDEEVAEEPAEAEDQPTQEEPQQDEVATENDGMDTNEDDEVADETNQE